MFKNKKTVIFILFLAVSNVIFAEIEIKNQLSDQKVENLKILTKVWGFLKYYHPNVADGDFNWDEEFLSMVPKVEGLTDKEDLSKIYLDWINGLGKIKKCTSCDSSKKIKHFENNFNLSWTQDESVFSKELSDKFKFIEENRFQGKQHYVGVSNLGVLEIKNEINPKDSDYPTRNYRLLSLARYWNTVEYFFPYKYLTDTDWNDVLTEMIPKFLNSKNASEYQLYMLETVVKLDDTHANFYSNEIGDFFGKKTIPVQLSILEDNVIIGGYVNDSLAKINNLLVGDIIKSVDGKDIMELIKINNKYLNGSNTSVKHKDLQFKISSGTSDSVKLEIVRGNEHLNKTVGRYSWEIINSKNNISGEKYKIMSNNIGYINMAYLEEKDVKNMMKTLGNTDGLIIDLRNYPNFMPFNLAKYFVTNEKSFATIMKPDLAYPGKFIQKKPKIISPNKKDYYKNKVAILVNNETQSAAEYSTMLLQTGDNVITVGNQTAGADGDTTTIQFMGFGTYISSLGVFYPDGSSTQRVGVKVDVNVVPTIEGMRAEIDEVLNKAIEVIK